MYIDKLKAENDKKRPAIQKTKPKKDQTKSVHTKSKELSVPTRRVVMYRFITPTHPTHTLSLLKATTKGLYRIHVYVPFSHKIFPYPG
jgi:hypothetical protein